MNSSLNSKNLVTAINTWAIPVIRYGAGILDWTTAKAKGLDMITRKILRREFVKSNSDIDRLYKSPTKLFTGRPSISRGRIVQNPINLLLNGLCIPIQNRVRKTVVKSILLYLKPFSQKSPTKLFTGRPSRKLGGRGLQRIEDVIVKELKKVTVISIVIGALGGVSPRLEKYLGPVCYNPPDIHLSAPEVGPV
eukprot:sb/3471025/